MPADPKQLITLAKVIAVARIAELSSSGRFLWPCYVPISAGFDLLLGREWHEGLD